MLNLISIEYVAAMEKILIIEDSKLQARKIADLLNDNEYAWEIADTGASAIDLLSKEQFDLILLDMVLPDIVGSKLIGDIKATEGNHNIPIIVISGLTDTENVIESLGMGINDYVTKPYNPNELIKRIQIHLNQKYLRDQLQLSIAANSKFLSVLGHDLRDSLSSIMSSLELMDKFTDSKEERENIMNKSKEIALRVSELMEELISWGKHLNNGESQNFELIDANDLLIDIGNKILPSLDSKGIKLECDLNESAKIYADKNMLESSLRNIISNAKKFTKKDGLITLSTKTIEENDHSYHAIIIEDTGVGMAESKANKLFEFDGNVINHYPDKNNGLGLGLMIAKQFIDKNHGKIKVSSVLGKGTKFEILFKTYDVLSHSN